MKELTSEQELILENNMVWLNGNDFQGNKWLNKLLTFKTNAIIESRITEHLAVLVGSARPHLVRRIDDYKKYDSYFFSDKYSDTWSYYLRKLILNRIFVEIGDISNKIIVEESSGVGVSDILAKCLPNFKMIMLVRRPIDTIQDIIMNVPDGRLQSENDRKLFIKIQIEWWNKLIKNFIDTSKEYSSNQFLLIKYEELRDNPNNILKNIFKFLEIEIDSKILNDLILKTPLVRKNFEDDKKSQDIIKQNFKNELSQEEKDFMDKETKTNLTELGYLIN